MTASVLTQDPNTKRFKQTLIYFNTDTQYAKSVKINYEIKTDEMLMTKAKPISH